MISEKEIFDRLMNGENLDDIMNEITGEVNKAIEAKKKADEEAEAKAKEEAEAKARKDAAMFNLDAIINGLCGLFVVYGYTDEAAELAKLSEKDKEDFLVSFDSMMEVCKAVIMLNGSTFPLGGSKPKVEVTVDKPVAKQKKIVVNDPFEEVLATEAKEVVKKKVIAIDPFEEFFKKFSI